MQHADVPKSTFYYWMKVDPVFKNKVNEMLSWRGTVVRDMLMTKAMEGDVRALTYLDKKFNKDLQAQEKTEVHIYHHTDKRPEESQSEKTFEDLLYDMALRRKQESESNA